MTDPEKQCPSEQAIQFRPRAVAMHGLHSFWDQAIVSVASFATMAFVGRLGKDEIGIFSLGISSFWLVAGISNALVWIPYTSRAAHLHGAARQQFRGDNAAINLFIAVLLATGSLFIAGAAKLWLPAELWTVSFFLFFSPMVFALTLREHVRRVFIADFEGSQLLRFDLAISVAMLSVIVSLYYFGRLNASLAMLVTAVAALPGLYVTLRHIGQGDTSPRRAVAAAMNNWPYAKWLFLMAVAWMLSDGLLRWMLVGIKGQEALGAFAGAFLIVSLVNPVLLAMTSFARSVASLRLATGSRLALTTVTIVSVQRLFIFAALAFVVLHICGDSFLVTVLGQSYSNPGLVSLLALAVCIEAVVVPIEASVVALEFGRLLSLVAAVRLFVSILMGLMLIPPFGDWGLAAAMLGRSLVVLIMYGFVLKILHSRFTIEADSQSRPVCPSSTEQLQEVVEHGVASEKAGVLL
jgi:O-antigen/teichoic acid export membrane protein